MQRLPYALQDGFCLDHNFTVPKPQDAQAARLKITGASIVVLDSIGVLAAVELDREASLVAVEIDEVRRNRVLPAEFPAAEAPIAQDRPEPAFCIGLPVPQCTGETQHIVREDERTMMAF